MKRKNLTKIEKKKKWSFWQKITAVYDQGVQMQILPGKSTIFPSKNQNISKPLKENLHLIFKNFVVYQRLFQAF